MATIKLIPAPHLFRECCWMVEKRGFCGETAFHVCFLMQTPTHLVLARRLLKHYPKLINDVYLSEEYYGELIKASFSSNNFLITVYLNRTIGFCNDPDCALL